MNAVVYIEKFFTYVFLFRNTEVLYIYLGDLTVTTALQTILSELAISVSFFSFSYNLKRCFEECSK